jgi:DeoR/GlpR family transcriptional regulator of sugar metabolism
MKVHRALVEKRRRQILDFIKKESEINVNDLAAKFQVSPITIRRDLQFLEDNKKVIRFYGGARLLPNKTAEKTKIDASREQIARYAAGLVEDGDTIFINTSSTALQMITYIKNKRVTVITNNGKALYTDHDPCVTIVLTGGEVREIKDAMVGEFAINNLNRVTAKKSFLGCSGLSPENGMTTEVMNEVNVNELMISRVTGQCYILASHEKLGVNSSFISCPAENLTNIITDVYAPESILDALRAMGVNVMIAGS